MRSYSGNMLSSGLGIGHAVVLNFNKKYFYEYEGISSEKKKVSLALAKANEDLKSHSDDSLMQIHLMLLNDRLLIDDIYQHIEYENLSAVASIVKVFDKYINMFKASDSLYLQERYLDLVDIRERLLNIITENRIDFDKYNDIILVVDELVPSLIIKLKDKIKGVVCRNGGYLSHAAIVCRSFDIPCICVNDFDIHTYDLVCIDTFKKMVFVDIDDETLNKYQNIIDQTSKNSYDFSHKGVNILCNASCVDDVADAINCGFDGVGLFRSEMVFLNLKKPLSVDEQRDIYCKISEIMKGKSACIRTFDIGDDKNFEFVKNSGKGINNYINNPTLFEDQIKAIILGNTNKNLSIMFPMIESKWEFEFLKNWVLRIKEGLNDKSSIKIGMMLETKGALLNIEDFKSVDFISVGTNDLCSQLYQLRRDLNEEFSYLDDLVLKLKRVVSFCNENNISLCICGELASDMKALVKFMEIGINNFSVSKAGLKVFSKVLGGDESVKE